MLRNDKAQRLCAKWMNDEETSALADFAADGIWVNVNHRLYLTEVQERIDCGKVIPLERKDQIELEQLKHFFEQKGLQAGINTVWHKDYYGQPIPFTTHEIPGMKPIKRLV